MSIKDFRKEELSTAPISSRRGSVSLFEKLLDEIERKLSRGDVADYEDIEKFIENLGTVMGTEKGTVNDQGKIEVEAKAGAPKEDYVERLKDIKDVIDNGITGRPGTVEQDKARESLSEKVDVVIGVILNEEKITEEIATRCNNDKDFKNEYLQGLKDAKEQSKQRETTLNNEKTQIETANDTLFGNDINFNKYKVAITRMDEIIKDLNYLDGLAKNTSNPHNAAEITKVVRKVKNNASTLDDVAAEAGINIDALKDLKDSSDFATIATETSTNKGEVESTLNDKYNDVVTKLDNEIQAGKNISETTNIQSSEFGFTTNDDLRQAIGLDGATVTEEEKRKVIDRMIKSRQDKLKQVKRKISKEGNFRKGLKQSKKRVKKQYKKNKEFNKKVNVRDVQQQRIGPDGQPEFDSSNNPVMETVQVYEATPEFRKKILEDQSITNENDHLTNVENNAINSTTTNLNNTYATNASKRAVLKQNGVGFFKRWFNMSGEWNNHVQHEAQAAGTTARQNEGNRIESIINTAVSDEVVKNQQYQQGFDDTRDQFIENLQSAYTKQSTMDKGFHTAEDKDMDEADKEMETTARSTAAATVINSTTEEFRRAKSKEIIDLFDKLNNHTIDPMDYAREINELRNEYDKELKEEKQEVISDDTSHPYTMDLEDEGR